MNLKLNPLLVNASVREVPCPRTRKMCMVLLYIPLSSVELTICSVPEAVRKSERVRKQPVKFGQDEDDVADHAVQGQKSSKAKGSKSKLMSKSKRRRVKNEVDLYTQWQRKASQMRIFEPVPVCCFD